MKFQIEREIKDIERYLERVERDKHLYDKSFLDYKRLRLAELKEQIKEL